MLERTLKMSELQKASVSFLNSSIDNGSLIASKKALQDSVAWTWQASAVASNKIDHDTCIVLVGQMLSIEGIESLFSDYFSELDKISIHAHALNDVFSNQALVIKFQSSPHIDLSTALLNEISRNYFIDCFVVSDVSANTPGLLVMDMDSTIIDMECIDEIAEIVNKGEMVADLTERAMQGELDFNQSLNARVNCLKGISVVQLDALRKRLPINPGFSKTIEILHDKGWKTCIASGGFTHFADHIKTAFNLDDAISNTLEMHNNELTGKVLGRIVNGEVKREVLKQKQKEYSVERIQTVAIGDGANDLLMMKEAQLGVAYRAKPKVKKEADASINYCGFEGLMYCLNWD